MKSKKEKRAKIARRIFPALKTALVSLFLWLAVSVAIFTGLYFSGFIPDYVKDFGRDALSALTNKSEARLPPFFKDAAVILIPRINLTSPIIFPTSTDLGVLDKALYKGVVHYPEAALPGEKGNVYIFGHSTNRPFVHNPAFTAFTNIHKLESGDDIFINSAGVSYHYRVTSVENLDPHQVKIYLASDKSKLTLSTCWPVGNPLRRTVVEAEYIGKLFI